MISRYDIVQSGRRLSILSTCRFYFVIFICQAVLCCTSRWCPDFVSYIVVCTLIWGNVPRNRNQCGINRPMLRCSRKFSSSRLRLSPDFSSLLRPALTLGGDSRSGRLPDPGKSKLTLKRGF